jgi:hypothetical protein
VPAVIVALISVISWSQITENGAMILLRPGGSVIVYAGDGDGGASRRR